MTYILVLIAMVFFKSFWYTEAVVNFNANMFQEVI